jgi:hypothetical protein
MHMVMSNSGGQVHICWSYDPFWTWIFKWKLYVQVITCPFLNIYSWNFQIILLKTTHLCWWELIVSRWTFALFWNSHVFLTFYQRVTQVFSWTPILLYLVSCILAFTWYGTAWHGMVIRAIVYAQGTHLGRTTDVSQGSWYLPHMWSKWGSNTHWWGADDHKSETLTTRPRMPRMVWCGVEWNGVVLHGMAWHSIVLYMVWWGVVYCDEGYCGVV